MVGPFRALNSMIRYYLASRRQKTSNRVKPWLETMEQRLAPAMLGDGGTALLSIALAANENLAIVSNGTSYTFTSNQNFTAAGGANPANQGAAFSGFGTKTLTLTSAGLAQYGTGINITDAGASASVTFNDSGTNGYANSFTVALGNTAAGAISFNGSSSFGSFNLQASTTRNILLNSGAFLTSSSGNLTLLANQQATRTSGIFAGVTINKATLQCTGTGLVSVQGRGATGEGLPGAAEYGVVVDNGGTIAGGIGTLAVSGAGGIAPTGNAYGVYVTGTGSMIQSSGGNVQITGQGGSATSDNNYGVLVGAGAQLDAGGTGNLTVVGTGGAGQGILNDGVVVQGTDGNNCATITSSGGNVQVTGQGGNGSSGSDCGIFVSAYGQIQAGGTGMVTVLGTGGATAMNGSNFGVYVAGANAVITSSGGNVLVTGQGGNSQYPTDYGVVVDMGGTIAAGDNGSVTTVGTGNAADLGVFVVNGAITSNGGSVNVTGNEGVWVLGLVSAGGCGDVTVLGTTGVVVGQPSIATAAITSGGGNVRVTGQVGNGQGENLGNSGVLVYGQISAGGNGNVVVQGAGGISSRGNNIGVEISGFTAKITSGGGSVQVTGMGGAGSGSSNYGIMIESYGQITAGGTGTVTVQGTGGAGAGAYNHGIYLFNAGINSGGGNVQVTGQGGGSAPSNFNCGIYLDINSGISAGGTGDVTVQGTGGAETSSQNYGIYVRAGDLYTNGGNLKITGVVGGGDSALALSLGSVLILTTTGGSITIIGDSLTFSQIYAATQSVSVVTQTPGTLINLGKENALGSLGLTGVELSEIQAGAAQIGDTRSGAITVSDNVTLAGTTNFTLTSGSDIILGPGSFNTGGGSLTLAPGGTGSVHPVASGTDVNVGSAALGFAPGANLAIGINGTTVDSQYDQLSVVGDINLSGANLALSGTLTPAVGQTFTIVNNQGTHPIIGTFTGLPEGAIIHHFLGSQFNAVISYKGGDGNDVVLTVKPAPPPPAKVAINSLSLLEGKSGLTPFVFTVKLPKGGAGKGPITYGVYTTDGTAKAGVNYVGITAGDAAHGGTVTFAQGATTATVTVYVIAGSIPVTPATARETFTVHLADLQDPGVSLATATGTIIAQMPSVIHQTPIPPAVGTMNGLGAEVLDQVFARLYKNRKAFPIVGR